MRWINAGTAALADYAAAVCPEEPTMTETVLDLPDRSPIARLSRAVADWFAPVRAAGLDLELQPAGDTDIQIDRCGDTLTIRGAVVTIRRPEEPAALAGSRKLYY
ncbi:hypothetical protein GCM10017083_20520 [Thalassobaculum fulvum]|uniref:Uncharacterized protein n=2 Tax=Thalassobaculum fulvum TaxID=1633335 RepID=A0A918XR80_9PROT|nr:hypothetical protein GCM10017083_20520 [Thalassobaculum fulvum]